MANSRAGRKNKFFGGRKKPDQQTQILLASKQISNQFSFVIHSESVASSRIFLDDIPARETQICTRHTNTPERTHISVRYLVYTFLCSPAGCIKNLNTRSSQRFHRLQYISDERHACQAQLPTNTRTTTMGPPAPEDIGESLPSRRHIDRDVSRDSRIEQLGDERREDGRQQHHTRIRAETHLKAAERKCDFIKLAQECKLTQCTIAHGWNTSRSGFVLCGVTIEPLTRLLAGGHRPHETVEGSVRGGPQVEIRPNGLDHSWVCLRQALNGRLVGKVMGNILPQESNDITFFLAKVLRIRPSSSHDSQRERKTTRGHVTSPWGEECWVIPAK